MPMTSVYPPPGRWLSRKQMGGRERWRFLTDSADAVECECAVVMGTPLSLSTKERQEIVQTMNQTELLHSPSPAHAHTNNK